MSRLPIDFDFEAVKKEARALRRAEFDRLLSELSGFLRRLIWARRPTPTVAAPQNTSVRTAGSKLAPTTVAAPAIVPASGIKPLTSRC